MALLLAEKEVEKFKEWPRLLSMARNREGGKKFSLAYSQCAKREEELWIVGVGNKKEMDEISAYSFLRYTIEYSWLCF